MSSLTFEQLKAIRPNFVKVDIPEWEGYVTLRKLSAFDRLKIVEIQEPMEKNDLGGIMFQEDAMRVGSHMIALSLVDDDGQLAFDGPEAVEFLQREDPRITQRLVDAIINLNGLGNDLKDEVEAAKKN